MIEVIKDKDLWNQQLGLIDHIDFYFTYDYHYISKDENEVPILIKYTEGNTSLLFPLLVRPIENTAYYDAVSVYGYAGVLAINIDAHFNKNKFHNELFDFLKKQKIVSVFSRLHPYIEYQESLLEGLGNITTLGKVVYIDLTEDPKNQKQMFSSRTKTYLNTSRKTCSVIESKDENHLMTFMELYRETMNRVKADEHYFFSEKYFRKLLTSEDFNAKLLLNIHDESQTVRGCVLCIEKGPFVQYHLSALNDACHDPGAIKLLIDEMRINSIKAGFTYLNLGGGRGSNEDSLFAFKSNFSKKFKDFKIWKCVVNEEIYRTLVENHLKDSNENRLIDADFFPAYRAKINVVS